VPVTSRNAARTAASSARSGIAAIRWASTSLSVSERKTTPALSSRARNCHGILDDAVVDHRDAVGAVAMRVGVSVARLAMCRQRVWAMPGRP